MAYTVGLTSGNNETVASAPIKRRSRRSEPPPETPPSGDATMTRRLQKTGHSKALLLTTPMLRHISGDDNIETVRLEFIKGAIIIRVPDDPDSEPQSVRRRKGSDAAIATVPILAEE